MRRLLLLVSTIVFVDAMLFGALTPLIPGYADEYDLSKTGAGLLAGAFGAGALAGGIAGGLLALRIGPKRTVVSGLVLFAAAGIGFALAGSPWALGLARLVQGFSSTVTWAGALALLTVRTPLDRRGAVIGTAFGVAVFGAILGPMFGVVAEATSIEAAFGGVGLLGLALAAAAATGPASPPETQRPGALREAFTDRRFVGGLWLNTLPALLFGTLLLLAPLALDAGGWTVLAIGTLFFASGLLEAALHPLLGRLSDRIGRLRPVRVALGASALVAAALATSSDPAVVAPLVVASALAFSAFYTTGMTIVSTRAELVGVSQALAFGVMNTAWALGNLAGPAAGGALAELRGDAVPYLVCSALCLVTLAATLRVGPRPSREALA